MNTAYNLNIRSKRKLCTDHRFPSCFVPYGPSIYLFIYLFFSYVCFVRFHLLVAERIAQSEWMDKCLVNVQYEGNKWTSYTSEQPKNVVRHAHATVYLFFYFFLCICDERMRVNIHISFFLSLQFSNCFSHSLHQLKCIGARIHYHQ